MSFFEWLGRVIMLVLAGMITLSIIGAIAAIPSGSNLPQQIGFEGTPAPEPERAPAEAQPEAAPEAGDAVQEATANGAAQVSVVPAPPVPVDPARWLEAITYALLALAGLAALGCLLLWRLVHQQRRIADAIESSPSVGLAPSR
jgi:hypothetical protein